MAKRIAGVAFIKYDGKQIPLKGNLNVSPSGFERSGIAGLDGVHGFSETPRVPFIECDTSALTPGISTEELEAIEDATVVAELADGRVYMLSEAWAKGAFEIAAGEGTMRIRFEGMRCEEIAA